MLPSALYGHCVTGGPKSATWLLQVLKDGVQWVPRQRRWHGGASGRGRRAPLHAKPRLCERSTDTVMQDKEDCRVSLYRSKEGQR